MAPRMLHWSSLAVLAAGLLLVGPPGIGAQESTVVCLSSFEWMNNSKSQNPCVVAAYLEFACSGTEFSVDPLPVGYQYIGPTAAGQNPCKCSTVTYSLMSACGLCQNNSIISWPSWDFNCSTVYSEIFQPGIPDGTAVPFWAYQNVTGTTFNVTLAQSVGDNPEATPTATQSTASVLSTSTSPLHISTSPSPSILPTGSSSLKTNTGAIAGGVVGGVVGVALIAAAVVFFVMKKRRSRIPPSAQFAGYLPPANPSNGYAHEPVPSVSPYSPQTTQPKLYDPSDPSTFPVTPPPDSTTRSSTNVPTSFVTYSNPSVRPGTGGAYTGMPEV